MAETAHARVTRLLSIVSFLEANGATANADLAQHFGVSVAQIESDLLRLWVIGLPGGMPDDLIDFDADLFERGIASITQTQGVTQVRLTAREATALLGALGAMTATGAAPEAATSAMVKLSEAVGAEAPVQVSASEGVLPETTRELSDAIARRRRARLGYVDANDRATVREVDPHRIVVIDGRGYLECYCHRAGGYRTLRLDRIDPVEVLEAPVEEPPRDGESFSLEAAYTARVRLGRTRRWVVDDIPDARVASDGDSVVAEFPVADATWAAATLLAAGSALESVEPAQLADEVRRQARAISEAHA